MARDQAVVECAPGVWTQLTNGDVTNITFQAIEDPIYIRFTAGASQPAANLSGLYYDVGQGEANKALSSLTALSGANRVWAKPAVQRPDNTSVIVDHA